MPSRLRTFLIRLSRAVRKAIDSFPLTPLGVLVALGGAAALKWPAYGSLDLVMLILGYGALGLTGASVLFVCAGSIRVIVALRRRDRPIVEARPIDTLVPAASGFSIPSLGWMPLVVSRWSIAEPASLRASPRSTRGGMGEELLAIDRGFVRTVSRRFVIGDVFGLACVVVVSESPISLDIFPGVGALRAMPLLTSFAGGEDRAHPTGIDAGDRVELRRYVPGDPARFVHWKIFARTRRLMVRSPERALTEARRTVAYLVAGPSDDASAAAARAAVEQGALAGDWTFGTDADTDRAATTAGEALSMIVRSIEARGRGAEGLAHFLSKAERSGPASIVIFAPPVPGAWMNRLLSAVRGRHTVRVVIGVDAVAERANRPLWRALLSAPPPREGTSPEELEAVVDTLERARVEVIVVERKRGQILSRARRGAMDTSQRRVA